MPDQSLLHSFDSLSVGREASPRLAAQDPLVKDMYSSPNSAPLDAPLSFSPFQVPNALPPMPEGVTPNMYSSRFQHLFANGVPPPSDGSSLTRSSSNEDEVFGQQPIDGGFELPGAAPGARPTLPFYSNTWGAPGAPASIATPAISFGADRNMPAGAAAAMQPPLQLGAGPIRFGGQLPTAPASSDTDIIPTAIVIKNIPFNIKREQLLHVIVRFFLFANAARPWDSSALCL